MIVDKLEPNYDRCFTTVIKSEPFLKFYDKVNTKAIELKCKIAFEFYDSAYWIFKDEDPEQNFDEVLQVFNYSTVDGNAYYTLVVKYTKGYLGNDSYDRDVYEGLDGKPFIIKVNRGSGYSLGSLYLKEPYMNFNTETGYTYNGEDLKRLNFLKGFKNVYNSELGYISHFLQEGFELVEYSNSNYWGHFEDNKGISVFQEFDHEYYTGSGKRAGHDHVYILQKSTKEKDVYINEKGTKFKVITSAGSPAYFGELIFKVVKD